MSSKQSSLLLATHEVDDPHWHMNLTIILLHFKIGKLFPPPFVKTKVLIPPSITFHLPFEVILHIVSSSSNPKSHDHLLGSSHIVISCIDLQVWRAQELREKSKGPKKPFYHHWMQIWSWSNERKGKPKRSAPDEAKILVIGGRIDAAGPLGELLELIGLVCCTYQKKLVLSVAVVEAEVWWREMICAYKHKRMCPWSPKGGPSLVCLLRNRLSLSVLFVRVVEVRPPWAGNWTTLSLSLTRNS